MTSPNNNDDILKLYELSQSNNKLMIAAVCFQTLVSLITALSLLWVSFRRKRPDLALQVIRKKEGIEKLMLELKALEKQAAYEANLARFEAGLKSTAGNEDKDLEKKTNDFINKATNEVNSLVSNKINSLLGKSEKEKK